MPVDCPLIFRRKHHGIEIKLNKESEENSLKKFKVTLTGHYQKTIALYDTGVTADYGDRLITLSTCEYSATNGRLVVVAKRTA